MSPTVKISSSGQWRQVVGSSSIVIADFYADWCGPCKMIAPTFESLSTKYSKPNKITFCKVDVDSQQDVAQQYSVRAMPTFLVLHNGSVIDTIQGANPPALTAAVDKAVKLAGASAGAVFSSGGHRLGGAGVGPRQTGGVGASVGTAIATARNWSLSGMIHWLVAFFGLYFTSLITLDPYKAAENSTYNVKSPPKKLVPGQAPGQRGANRPAFKTMSDLDRNAMIWSPCAELTSSHQPLTMISASKIQNRCPGCKAQLLGFYDALLVSRSRAGSRPFHASPSLAAAHRRQPLNPVRRFSTTRRLLEDPPSAPDASPPRDKRTELKAEDTETIVRQARQTFGQTLPPGYLTDQEYRLYERLFGPPIRETRPQDVGIPFPGEGGDIIENESGNALLRETEDGGYEEVDYDIVNPTIVDESQEIVEESFEESAEIVDEYPMAEEEIDAEADAEATALLQSVLKPQKEVTISAGPFDYLSAAANNQREYDALLKLQQDFESSSLEAAERAEARDAEEAAEQAARELEPTPEAEEIDLELQAYEEEIDEYEAEYEERTPRTHPNTALGLFGTHPSTVFLPAKTFVEPISELLKRTSLKHVQEAAEKAFGGRGLPFSPATPKIKGKLAQKGLQLEAGHHQMSEIDADAYIATVLPGVYATVMNTLVETRKRLGAGWIEGLLARDGGKGPRVLDVGAGGAGLAAWEEVLRAEWDVLREKQLVTGPDPPGKKTVVVGSDELRHRISRFLHNTSFIPRLPDYMHSVEGSERMLEFGGQAAPRKMFDVIICSHVLMPMESAHRRKAVIDNLWAMLDPNGGVLIVIEKGHPRGFEAVADVRQRLLDEFIIPPHPEPVPEELVATSEQAELKRQREPGMIVAPCTNHRKCPMYQIPGLAIGRKDACHFDQRFIRPPFLQRIVGGPSARNHEDIKFSYLVVRRGMTPSDLPPPGLATYLQGKEAADRSFAGYNDPDDPPNPLSLPRSVLPALKRHGHVTFQLCTPEAAIERWVVPRSFSQQAYRDARKSQWGDLWALGAKTRVHANVRLGKGGADSVLTDGGVRSRRAAEAATGRRPKVIEILHDPLKGMVGAKEKHPKGRVPLQRRTKRGNPMKVEDLLKEAGIDDMEDADDIEDREFMKNSRS
ncbi:hypothetical protein QBC39DRAFT_432752 [Podospora conica]|nr:hypothetical protein QBC39DRAFT_432752 [Schizothecium conicum]